MKTLYKASVILFIFLAIVVLTSGTAAASLAKSPWVIIVDPNIPFWP